MTTFIQVADGLVTRLQTITSLANRSDPYPNPNPNPPCALVVPGANEFDLTYNDGSPAGLTEQAWTIRVLVGRGDDRSAARRLYAYMDASGSDSVKTAIEGDRTLGGLVDEACVTGFEEPSIFQYGSGLLLGVDFNVTVNL
jgi:hypothetical protein